MGIGSLYFKAVKYPDDLLSRLFLLISYPAHFFSISVAAFLLVMIIGLFWPKRRTVGTVAVIAALVMVVMLLVDAGVYSLYRFHLNGMVWNLITSGVAGEVLSLTWTTWLTLATIIAGFLLLELFIAKLLWANADRLKFGMTAFLLLLFLLVTANIMHAWADYVRYVPITRIVRMLPAFKPVTWKRQMQRLGFTPGTRSLEIGWGNAGSGLAYPLEQPQFNAKNKPYNLLMIVIDSWRFDMLTQEATPNIWDFATKSTVFEQHYSASNCTRFGIFSLFYGLYGTYWHSFLAEQRGPVMLSELKRLGYDMGIFASAPLSNPEFDRTVFIEVGDSIKQKIEGVQAVDRDRQITKKILDFVNSDNRIQPFFGFLFYDAPHAKQFPPSFAINKPYVESLNYLTLNNAQDVQPVINSYKNALRFVDGEVGEVLSALQRKGKLENTIVLITGDHGEEFNDLKLGYWGHNGNFAQFQTRTPLVLHFPGQTPHRYNHLTTSLDVAPTLMRDMLGSTTDPDKYSNGTYLNDSRQRPFVHVSTWSSFALIEPKRICIVENRGSSQIVDCSYNDLSGEAMNPVFSKTAIEAMSRFYKQ